MGGGPGNPKALGEPSLTKAEKRRGSEKERGREMVRDVNLSFRGVLSKPPATFVHGSLPFHRILVFFLVLRAESTPAASKTTPAAISCHVG